MYSEQEISKLENRIQKLEQENKTLHETVEFLTHKLFGRSSEKTSVITCQMYLFNEAEVESNASAPEPTLQEVSLMGNEQSCLKIFPMTQYFVVLKKMNVFAKNVEQNW